MIVAEFIIQHEAACRLSVFLSIFGVMALWEVASPRRPGIVAKVCRWGNNLTLGIFNSVLLRLLFPAGALGVAAFADANHWGVFNYFDLPLSVALTGTLVLMDLTIYLQHRLVHYLPFLWRFHQVHHADLNFDVTTGVRFHPAEIVFSMLIKFCAIMALGPPLVTVVIFEVVLNSMAMFNHANVGLPDWLERWLRRVVVTPDMHRVHHSVDVKEYNSNFGFNLSIWDRLFDTYTAQPQAGHTGMSIGISTVRDPKQVVSLAGMLALPFKRIF